MSNISEPDLAILAGAVAQLERPGLAARLAGIVGTPVERLIERLPDGVQSEINGGSAVMYEPGKILKSGGVHRGDNNPPGGNIADVDDIAEFGTETIDLSTFASGDYATAPDFTWVERQDMNRARHLHTLTVLPDGRVAATGGNTRSNGIEGDHPENECNLSLIHI